MYIQLAHARAERRPECSKPICCVPIAYLVGFVAVVLTFVVLLLSVSLVPVVLLVSCCLRALKPPSWQANAGTRHRQWLKNSFQILCFAPFAPIALWWFSFVGNCANGDED